MDDVELEMALVVPVADALIEAIDPEGPEDLGAALTMACGGLASFVALELARHVGEVGAALKKLPPEILVEHPYIRVVRCLIDAAADPPRVDPVTVHDEEWESLDDTERLAVLIELTSLAYAVRKLGF